MNWILYSLMMFVSSVALYLVVRKSSLVKIPTPLTNLAMFGIPLIAYAAIGAAGTQAYSISVTNVIILAVTAVVFAYGGNTVSLKAIEIAPNPGYSLVLSKSYVLFTTLVAVTLLHAELAPLRAIAILVIVGFSVLVMVNRRATKAVNSHRWVTLSFEAFFAWGFLSLSSKYLFTHGVCTIPFLIYLYAIVTVCILVAHRIRLSTLLNLRSRDKLLLVGTGIFSTLFNLGQFEAIKLAPNVGYVNAVNAASISLVTILAVLIFKDELTPQKAVGVAGVTAGLILLLI